ncbi:MAG: preprotein translocase subunit SecG [Patescibacteria group bacterium]|nr:preprotein translocase subunit SecG [Patescibacteria group bacterium]
MSNILSIIQIVISVFLMITILIQNKGVGLSATFGGEGNVYRTKRGAERAIFITTIVLAVLFLVTAMLNLFF